MRITSSRLVWRGGSGLLAERASPAASVAPLFRAARSPV